MERPERTGAAPDARALPADEKTERSARAWSSDAGPTAGKQQRQKPTGATAATRSASICGRTIRGRRSPAARPASSRTWTMTRATLAATAHSRPAEQGCDAKEAEAQSAGVLYRRTDCLSMQTLDGQAAKAGELRTVWASAERGQQTVWEAFGARAMKDADLEEQRACWDNRRTSQAGNAARTQQEYDDDESGATALKEGVEAIAGGRVNRPSRVLEPHRAGVPPVEGSTLGGGSKTVVPLHF